jgi:DNA-binding transcriptional LysR family regulator
VSFIMLTEAMIEMAKAGLGVGVLPRWSAQSAISAGAVVALSITPRGVGRQWSAATLRARPEPECVADFISLIARRAMPAGTPARHRPVASGRNKSAHPARADRSLAQPRQKR